MNKYDFAQQNTKYKQSLCIKSEFYDIKYSFYNRLPRDIWPFLDFVKGKNDINLTSKIHQNVANRVL